MKILEEESEQIAFINWFRMQYAGTLIYHIPNGGKRGIQEGAKFKKMGVVSGVPDLHIPRWNCWIEMKREKGGSLSDNQKKIIGYLESIGHTVIVARGCVEAIEKIKGFVNEKK